MRIRPADIKCHTSTTLYDYYKRCNINPLNSNDYKKVMQSITTKIIDECVKGKKIRVPELGTFEVVTIERAIKKKVIDWKSSWENKKAILDRGDIPLKGENGGEPWLEYQENGEPYIRLLVDKSKEKYAGKWVYGFKSSHYARQAMYKAMSEDEFATIRYDKRN